MINLAPFKQQIENNLAYGENSREANRIKNGWVPVVGAFGKYMTLSASLVMPNTVQVWGIDISHWNLPGVDLQRMKDLYGLRFVIIKGMDGTLKSKYFDEHKAAAKAAGLPWGIYNWLYPNNKVLVEAQVNAWYTQAQADPPPLGNFFDAEWTTYGGQPANPIASDLRMAHDKWKAKAGKSATTYTAQGYANQYLVGFDWSKEPLWIANYGVTSPALPTGAKGYRFWQFTSTLDGKALDPNGNAELDGDYFNGTQSQFETMFGIEQAPQPVEHTTPAPGIDEYTEIVNGVKVHITLIDKTGKTFHIRHFPGGLGYVSQVAKETGALVAFNGIDYNEDLAMIIPYAPAYTAGVAVNGGNPEFRYFLNISPSNDVTFTYKGFTNFYNTTAFVRPLVIDGAMAPDIRDNPNKLEYVEVHACASLGVTNDGRLIQIAAEGKYPSTGVTVPQLVNLNLRYGARFAGQHGGGGDMGKAINGTIINSFSDPQERGVAQVIYVTGTGANMSRYEATAIGDNTKLRPNHNTLTDFNPIQAFPAGAKFYGDTLWVADATNKDASQYVGDKWLQLDATHWVAIVHRGVAICTLKDNGTTPAPAGDISFDATLRADGTITGTWKNI